LKPEVSHRWHTNQFLFTGIFCLALTELKIILLIKFLKNWYISHSSGFWLLSKKYDNLMMVARHYYMPALGWRASENVGI
jgi:hypothetical protein